MPRRLTMLCPPERPRWMPSRVKAWEVPGVPAAAHHPSAGGAPQPVAGAGAEAAAGPVGADTTPPSRGGGCGSSAPSGRPPAGAPRRTGVSGTAARSESRSSAATGGTAGITSRASPPGHHLQGITSRASPPGHHFRGAERAWIPAGSARSAARADITHHHEPGLHGSHLQMDWHLRSPPTSREARRAGGPALSRRLWLRSDGRSSLPEINGEASWGSDLKLLDAALECNAI